MRGRDRGSESGKRETWMRQGQNQREERREGEGTPLPSVLPGRKEDEEIPRL